MSSYNEWNLRAEHIDRYLELIEDDHPFIMRKIWVDRLGPKKWNPRHGATQSFTNPGAYEKAGAIKALRYVRRILVLSEENVRRARNE